MNQLWGFKTVDYRMIYYVTCNFNIYAK